MIAGIDLGGTQVRVAVGDGNGRIVGTRRCHTGQLRTAPRVVSWASQQVTKLCGGEPLRGLAIGAPGPIDQSRGVLANPPNLPGWRDVPLVRMLGEELGCPVRLENDANLAAVGEHRRGAGQGSHNMIYITWSTGVGGGLIMNDHLWSGEHGSAGEIGHMIIDPDGPLDACGQRGCLEAFCGGRALGERYQVPAAVLFQSAAEGDVEARRHVEEAARYMGLALINLANLFDPELFVMGGGVTRSWPQVAPVLRSTLRSSPYVRPSRRPRLRRARLGDDGGLVGAVEWARMHL